MRDGTYFGEAVVQAPVARRTHAFVSKTSEATSIAATHFVLDHGVPEILKLPSQEACIITVAINGGYERDLYLEDRVDPIDTPVSNGSFSFFDMRQRGRLRATSRAEHIQFFFPIASINSIALDADRPAVDHLRLDGGQVVTDPIMERLANTLLPSFLRPDDASRFFVDHVMLAVATHVATTYGGVSVKPTRARGGLSSWQRRRAMEMLSSDLCAAISLEEVARTCGISLRHFARAFAQSTGFAPHQWLLRLRVDRAKDLLRTQEASLSDVAAACGFSDQSHFTRIFSDIVGTSPGMWRRRHLAAGSVANDPGRRRAR